MTAARFPVPASRLLPAACSRLPQRLSFDLPITNAPVPDDVATPENSASAFAELGLDPRIITTLATLGYEEPTPIQRAAIPVLLDGRDVLGQAATGTGKTAAFTLPLIQRAALGAGVLGGVVEGAMTDDGADDAAMDFDRRGPSVLILVPTRELAMQVGEAVHKYGKGLGIRAVPVYGGQDIRRQLRALERGADVVIATPGRSHPPQDAGVRRRARRRAR